MLAGIFLAAAVAAIIGFAMVCFAKDSKAHDARSALSLIGGTMGYGLLGAAVGWVVRQRLPPRGRLVFTLVCVALAIGFFARFLAADARSQAVRKEYQQALARVEEQRRLKQAAFDEIEQQLLRADPGPQLTAANLSTSAGIASARDALARFRDLLARRRALARLTFEDLNYTVNLIPPGPASEAAQARLADDRRRFDKAFLDLDGTQETQCKAVTAMLDWAQAHAGTLSAQGDRLLMRNPVDRAKLEELMAALARATAASRTAADALTTAVRAGSAPSTPSSAVH